MTTLNQGQEAAAEGFFGFLFSDEKELIISGPGGVGKSFLMAHLIDKIMPRYFEMCKIMGIDPLYTGVQMTATTNKAAEVLAQATQRPTDTIHSFLNLKVQDDFSTGEQKLTQTNNWMVHGQKIIFVDECSMVDRQLLKFIDDGTLQCKVVYVGDHCQLAPVKEVISPIYTRELPFFQLTEPMRSSIPELLAVQAQLRETVESGMRDGNPTFQPIKIVPGVIDHLGDGDMQAMLHQEFCHQTHNSRILAYTNARVMEYNDYIRQIRQLPEEYTPGEFLVNNSAIRLRNRMLSVEEELTVLTVSPDTQDIEIEDGVHLTVREMALESSIGEVFGGVPVPVDRDHFTKLKKYYASKKNWNRHFFLKNTYPDLRPRDAATVHKSQGSTYDSVFIDLGNISTCHQPNAVARMLYVAFTRPRTRVYLFGELASKYGGLIR